MDLVYLFNSLMRRKWLILTSTLLAIAIAFLFTMNQKRLYKSEAQIATGFTTGDQVKLKDESFNIYEIDVKFNNVMEILRSPKVVGMLSYSLMIHDLENPKQQYRVIPSDDRKAISALGLNMTAVLAMLHEKYDKQELLSSTKPEERKIIELLRLYKYDQDALRKTLYTDRVSRTDFIDIQYRAGNPDLAAYVVNQLCVEFFRNFESSRTQQTAVSIQTLQKLMEQKKAELDLKIDNMKTQGGVDVSVENTSRLEQISNYDNRIADEKSILNQATLGLSLVTKQLQDANAHQSQITAASNAVSGEISNLRNQMNAAYTDYVNKGSSDQDLFNKYQKLKADYKNKLSSLSTTTGTTGSGPSIADLQQKKNDLEIQIQSSTTNIASYQQKIRELNSSLGASASRGATNVALQKELDLAQQEYEDIKSRYDAMQNNKVAPGDNLRQILYGQPAVEPEPSKRMIILGLAGMSALMLCCLIIIFLEYIDVSIKTPSIFQKNVPLKLIGTLNHLKLKQRTLFNIFTNPSESNRNENVFRENVRKLRYEIESSGANIFLFTSIRPGEGKTTVLEMISQSLLKSGKKVLLIDANFPNNSLTRNFEAAPHLEEMAKDPSTANVAQLKRMITYSETGIAIIGCEGGNYTPAEILPTPNVLNHLAALIPDFDFIFLEAASLNRRSDARELLQYVQKVAIVVSSRSSVKQTDKESIQFLKQLHHKFAGAILNDIAFENLDL